jgi:hypothetical protein
MGRIRTERNTTIGHADLTSFTSPSKDMCRVSHIYTNSPRVCCTGYERGAKIELEWGDVSGARMGGGTTERVLASDCGCGMSRKVVQNR